MKFFHVANEVKNEFDPFNLNPHNPEEPDLDGLLASQMNAAWGVFGALDAATAMLAMHLTGERFSDGGEVLAATKQYVKIQGAHLERYVRIPQNPKLPSVYRQLGNRIDRVGLQACRLLGDTIALYESPYQKRSQSERAAEHDLRRQERIERRRQDREERRRREAAAREAASEATGAAVRAAKPKLEHAVRPRCTKCQKRPQSMGTLCASCARWEARR